MPVYDQGYRRFEGPMGSGFANWWVITKSEIILRFSRKLLLFLLIIPSFLPMLGMMIAVYVMLQIATSDQLPMGASIIAKQFLDQVSTEFYFLFFKIHASTFLLLWGAFVGSDLISNDRKTNAMELYFTRPIRPVDYLLGKFGTLVFFLLFTTMLPALLLYLFAISVAPEAAEGTESYFEATKHVPGAIVFYSFVQAIVVSTFMLALSSLGRNWILVGAIWGGVYLFSQVGYRIVQELSGSGAAVAISLRDSLLLVGRRIFQLETEVEHWEAAAWMLGILTVSSLLILCRRIRVVETVK